VTFCKMFSAQHHWC